jgi:hypothetical protein
MRMHSQRAGRHGMELRVQRKGASRLTLALQAKDSAGARHELYARRGHMRAVLPALSRSPTRGRARRGISRSRCSAPSCRHLVVVIRLRIQRVVARTSIAPAGIRVGGRSVWSESLAARFDAWPPAIGCVRVRSSYETTVRSWNRAVMTNVVRAENASATCLAGTER